MALLARTDPEEPLLDHLQGVASLAEGFLAPLGLGPEGRVLGLCHDLGKATPYFQEMLRGKRPRGDPLTWHALPGALFAAWVAQKEGLKEPLSFFLAILGHHGSLPTPWNKLPLKLLREGFPREGAWKGLPEQLKALAGPDFRALVQALGLPDPTPFLEGEALEVAKALALEADALLNQEGEDLSRHFHLALLYSALLDADRRQAGRTPPPSPAPIPPGAVEAYLRGRPAQGPLAPTGKPSSGAWPRP
ncbi:CRISPR-associated helicase Cas3 [Thermus thermophilus]|nr:CRISPR-associated helicase Cas3 [Thermus thermophilus]